MSKVDVSSHSPANLSTKKQQRSEREEKYRYKWFLLFLFVLQNSSTVLVGRYTRSSVLEEDLYEVHHMIVVTEALKLLLSGILEYFHTNGNLIGSLELHILGRPYDCLKVALPAILYYCQNYVVYCALSFISAPLFQVTYQSKLVTTAILSVLLLGRRYSVEQWLCIMSLCIGVGIVTVTGEEQKAALASTFSMPSQDMLFGLCLVGIACLCSSLAGVYFEKVLKNKTNDNAEPVSVWMRNIQLSICSVCIALIQDTSHQSEKGFFHGFTVWVCLQILLLGAGGLLVAAVMKYTSSVTKGLATGISVVVSTVVSNILWGKPPLTPAFALGSTLIVGGVYVFQNPMGSLRISLSFPRFMIVLVFWGIGSIVMYNMLLSRLADDLFQSYGYMDTVQSLTSSHDVHPFVSPYDKVVDVLSFGSNTRSNYQLAQRRTWASHASVRYYFGVTEDHDVDRECTHLTDEDIFAISNFCKRNRVRHNSNLKRFQSNLFARKQFLQKKDDPVGWMCCMPRPTLGISAAMSYYTEHQRELPDYLLIVDDDTYYNMEIFQQHFSDRSSEEPEAWAGCLVQHAVSLFNLTFPHGGFGVSLSKAALRNLIEPIHCDEGSSSSEFVQSACQRLQEPLYEEAQLFRPGMSLIDLMFKYVTFQPYSMYKNWTTGFCQHGDWLWGYFFNFYNLTNHISPTDPKEREFYDQIPQARTQSYFNNSVIYGSNPGIGQCRNEGKLCELTSGICHHQTPAMMEAAWNQTRQQAKAHAYPLRQDDHFQHLKPLHSYMKK